MQYLKQILLPSLLFLVYTAVCGQEKKNLTPADYDRWYHFHSYNLSPDAKWINYVVKNPKGKDTMVLRRTDKPFKQLMMGGSSGVFSPKSDYFAFQQDTNLFFQELKTGKRDSIIAVNSFFFSKGGTCLIGDRKKEKELIVVHLATRAVQVLSLVENYRLSPDSTKIAFVQQKDNQKLLRIIQLNKVIELFDMAQSTQSITHLTWNFKGNGLAFFEAVTEPTDSPPNYLIHYLTFRGNQVSKVLHQQTSINLAPSYLVPMSNLFFSKNDEQLFFDVKEKVVEEVPQEQVIIWSSKATVLPPVAKKNNTRFLMCWHLKANKFIEVSTEQQPTVVPLSSGKHALVIDDSNYQPFFKHGGIYVDLYLKDLNTGTNKLIAQKIHDQRNHITVSPNGKYINWFKDNNWWIYDIDLKHTRCLTCSTLANFENKEHDSPGHPFPNDKPYWSTSDQYILLSDFYDVWLFTPDGKTKKRITKGGIKKSMFRVYDHHRYAYDREHFIKYCTHTVDLKKGLLFSELNTQTLEEGFHSFESNTTLKCIVYTDDKIRDFQKVGNTYLYALSDFDKSPELVLQRDTKTDGEVIQRSNEHQKKYHWGKSELLHYQANGASLKGALFYPANYQAHKKYPMIVISYHKLSKELRMYEPPSLYNSIGMNVTHLTSSGYFVLKTDVHYTINETSKSALLCVTAAVDKAVETASIDTENIGLFGFSFGGNLVSYIISQTNRFKTAISGGGIHDFFGTYLWTDDDNKSSMWRFETQQLRLTEPFYSQKFLDNSPIVHVHTIETPILLWVGQNDTRVRGENSSKLQMALWRLGKESTFLMYPGEPHFILNKENQIDLSTKTLQWYNYYLKNEIKPEWIE